MIENQRVPHKMCHPFKFRLKMKKRTAPNFSPESGVTLFAPVHVPKQVVRGLLKKIAARQKKERQDGQPPRS
jgi:hypothetical protein